jgi:hypothetical protein
VLVLHTAELANSNALANGLQLLVAHLRVFTGLAAFGSSLMGRRLTGHARIEGKRRGAKRVGV